MNRHLRLDQEVARRFPDLSRRRARQLIADRRVLVDGQLVAVASRPVSAGQAVTVFREPPQVTVLGMTNGWIAVDKKPGIPTQPPRQRDRPSLLEATTVFLAGRGDECTLYLLHRLDTGTSGVVLFARTEQLSRELSAAFAGGLVQKSYLALLTGRLREARDVDAPIGRVGTDRFGVIANGRSAVTHFQPIAESADATLVSATIEQGRTHQIRLHASRIGHPVIGDRKYGTVDAERLMLHAASLAHPSIGEISAPVPEDFRRIAEAFAIQVSPT